MSMTFPTAVWAVTIRVNPGGEDDEVAAVFTDYDDAHRHTRRWNWEETRRFGPTVPRTATAEETDHYPAGTWHEPAAARPHRTRISLRPDQ